MHRSSAARGPVRALIGVLALALLAAGCNQEAKTEPPQPRPVRTVTVEKGEVGDSVQLTGDIRAENEVNLAFRVGGRIIERKGGVGDKVEPDQVLAKLDPQDELNALRSAQAALTAARAQEVEAQNNFDRQNHLMERGFTTRAIFDSAKQGLQTAQARVDDATAQLDIAQDRVSFTELKANVSGTITARSAESGQVVQAGQPIFTVARQDGRDAVFDVPAQVLRAAPHGCDDHDCARRRPVGDREGARAHRRSAGRSGHPHFPGQAQPDRSSRGDAPRRDGDRAPSARGRQRASRFRRAR